MEVADMRHRLHDYIDKADDQDIESFYEILQEKGQYTSRYTDEEMAVFEERWQSYKRGEGENYTVKESINRIRASRR